jgi:FAD/FMN-containing dehydrogenase
MAEKKELTRIVGRENVSDDPEALDTYSRVDSFVHPIRPRYVVRPKNLDEVQAIVKWANKTFTPLVPVSSGSPRFRGDTVPSVGGAVIVDLCRMKRIIRVDRKNRVVMIEPGVTFNELAPALNKEGLAPFMPLVPRNSKSVVASCLEREPITTPRSHWETQDPLLCTEVVYGSGDLFRTGSAAGPGTIEEQWEVGRAQLRGLGPSQLDFTRLIQGAQGTMGIVTWATMKCKIQPKVKQVFLVPSEQLEGLIDFVQRLLWKRLGNDYIILNAHNLACILAENTEGIKSLRALLPPWIFIFSIEGSGLMPEEKVVYQQAEFAEVAQKHGLEPKVAIPGTSSDEVLRVFSGPSKEPYWKLRFKGSCHDIFFLTTLDQVLTFVSKMYNLASYYRYPPMDIGIYIQPTVQGTNCHCEFNMPYNPQSSREVGQVKALDQEACSSLANLGAFFSRPYGHWASVAYGRDAATVIALRKVKNIFDPNGIMNPGKLCF